MDRKIPTPEKPCRSVVSTGSDPGSVSGQYQVVVELPDSPTKKDELLAFADAAESLAELARKWAESEPSCTANSCAQAMRVTVSVHMRPEGASKP
ncbi:MAG: hypothetical protein QG675_599 [Patescibacteria group bacterium]|jgi:hypothetical protein|nr:hypothetical protein [Patescibacteria group bacterium]